jgi:hypothetical protein
MLVTCYIGFGLGVICYLGAILTSNTASALLNFNYGHALMLSTGCLLLFRQVRREQGPPVDGQPK